MPIPFSLQVSHWASLQRSSLRRLRGTIRKNSSANFCSTAPRHIRSSESLGRRLAVSVLLAILISGLMAISLRITGATAQVAEHPTTSPAYQLGAPCSTLTDLREGTCNLKVDKIKRNAGQPKPFTNNWRN